MTLLWCSSKFGQLYKLSLCNKINIQPFLVDSLIMLPITILQHNTLCCSFFLNAITISTVSDFVCDNKRPRCLSVSYTKAYTPTSDCDYNFLPSL